MAVPMLDRQSLTLSRVERKSTREKGAQIIGRRINGAVGPSAESGKAIDTKAARVGEGEGRLADDLTGVVEQCNRLIGAAQIPEVVRAAFPGGSLSAPLLFAAELPLAGAGGAALVCCPA